jgi:hypothetical protein
MKLKNKIQSNKGEKRKLSWWVWVVTILILYIIVILSQFILPWMGIYGKNLTALQGFIQYHSLHWGFYYFPALLFVVLVSFFFFLIGLKKKLKYPNIPYYLSYLAVVVQFSLALPLEDFLKSNNSFQYKALMPNAMVTLFALLFIGLIGLISYMNKNRVNYTNKNKQKSDYSYDLKDIIIVAIAIPLCGFVGVKLGIGAILGGAIGGLIAYMIRNNFKKKNNPKKV